MSDASLDHSLICPVCRAAQAWSDSCRRCRCDLSLLRRADAACRQARRQALLDLRDGRWAQAQRAVRACYALQPAADSRRLLAVCCLLGGDFQQAVEWARDP